MQEELQENFNISNIQAVSGELAGTISSNSIDRKRTTLEHNIIISLTPFASANKKQAATVCIFSLQLGVNSWRKLEERVYTFPEELQLINKDNEQFVAPDQAYGSMHLSGKYIPVYSTRLAFGKIINNTILTELDLIINLKSAERPRTQVTIKTDLIIAGVQVIGDLDLIERPAAERAQQLAEQFLDLEDYEQKIVKGIYTYIPSFPGLKV